MLRLSCCRRRRRVGGGGRRRLASDVVSKATWDKEGDEKKKKEVVDSVTRLGDLVHFGQLFKARGNRVPKVPANFRQFL